MLIGNLFDKDIYETWLFLERYVNDGSTNKHTFFSEASSKYQPRVGKKYFTLPFSHPDNKCKVKVFGDKKRIAKLGNCPENEGTLFFVHPDMLEYFPKSKWIKDKNYLAVPTSSTRTVFLKNHELFCKLDFKKKLSRFTRELEPRFVQHSCDISEELEKIVAKKSAPESLAFLPEFCGISASIGRQTTGVIYRSPIPHPKTKQKRIVVPFFSLFSKDIKNPHHKPMLVQLIGNSGSSATDYLRKNIFSPLIDSWLYLVFNHGLIPSAHPQNLLLELDESLTPRRVIYRDLKDFYVDTDFRKEVRMKCSFAHRVLDKSDLQRYKQEYSIAYDYRLGVQVFDRIIAVARKYLDIDESNISASIKQQFSNCKELEKRFPDCHYELNDKVMFSDNLPDKKCLPGTKYR